jgi:hypothetical protein
MCCLCLYYRSSPTKLQLPISAAAAASLLKGDERKKHFQNSSRNISIVDKGHRIVVTEFEDFENF